MVERIKSPFAASMKQAAETRQACAQCPRARGGKRARACQFRRCASRAAHHRAGEAAASGGPFVRSSARSLVSVALRKTIVGYPSLPTMWCLAVEECRLRCSLDYDEPGGPSIMYAQLIDAPG